MGNAACCLSPRICTVHFPSLPSFTHLQVYEFDLLLSHLSPTVCTAWLNCSPFLSSFTCSQVYEFDLILSYLALAPLPNGSTPQIAFDMQSEHCSWHASCR